MEEFDEDDFSDLYADVEVQASSAINAMHEFREMPHRNDEVSGNVVDGFTQFPGDDHGIFRRGDEEGNGFSEIEITEKNGGSCDNATEGEVVEMTAEEDGLLKLLSEDGDTHESESESESEDDLDKVKDGNDDDKQKIVDNYDDNNVESRLMSGRQHRVNETVDIEKIRGKGKCVSEKRLKARDYESKGKQMGPNYVASSSNMKAICPAGALWEDNHCSLLMDQDPVVHSRASRRLPASPPLSYDLPKYGSVRISDSKDSHEVSECDLDGVAETSDGTKNGSRVEAESSQSDQRQRSPAVSCFSSPSATVNTDDEEINHKHSKKYQSNSLSEKCYYRSNKSKSDGVKPITRETRNCEGDRHPLKYELKERKRSNHGHNVKTDMNDKDDFDVRGFNLMNKPYHMRSDSSFTYFRGLLPYRQVGPAYLGNHFWNIYPAFGYDAGWYNGHDMNAGGCFLEKERPNTDYVGLQDNWYRSERRHANLRATQFNKKGHDMQFRSRTKRDDLSPPYEHNEDSTKGKFRRYGRSTHGDRDCVDHRHDQNIPFDRREIKSPVRSKRQCESPSNSSNYSWHMENEGKDRKYIKTHRESGWYGSSNTTFDTSVGLSYNQGEDHLERRRHYRQSTNTNSCTAGSIKNNYDHNRFGRRNHHQLSEVLRCDENEYKSGHQDDKMFLSGDWSAQFEREENNRVTDLPDEREENKRIYKMKRESYSSNQFDQYPKFNDPDRHLPKHLRYQDSVGTPLVVGKKCNLQSSRRDTEAEDAVYHSRYGFEELNDDQNFKDVKDFNPGSGVLATEGKVNAKHCDKSKHDKLFHNEKDEFLDIEEGQIITEDIDEKSMEECKDVKPSNDVVYSKAALNGSRVERIDDERIKEILAKMEKRRERFSEPITPKKDPEKISMHLPVLVVETAEGKIGRPARKRRWVGS